MAAFDIALTKTLAHEGGKSDDPADPGGRTNQGVTQKVYDRWKISKHESLRDVWDIDPHEVTTIYLELFWIPSMAGAIDNQDVANKYFDVCVNTGLRNGCEMLQMACSDAGHPTIIDGDPGSNTLHSVNSCDPQNLLIALKQRAVEYYRDLVARKPSLGRFLNGWTNRAMS